MTRAAQRATVKSGRIQGEDMLFAIRKDNKRYTRAIELLKAQDEITKARKMFEDDVTVIFN
eukprot:CAMPEP_0174266958 /NCGR_PEP_ID=MMETSP0439-20130205/31992_1 /TAXON_ID=0 /ORGANISM="Stereomyxa ramosa, Strain Chinc5" /LENGTH=60 /DNA_ID=CAMNT_0015354231 /DNA_START=52 /DNA_END=234 /DNA_ORIENTATION=+